MRYVSLKIILDKILRDSLFSNIQLEAAIDYCVSFFSHVDVPQLFIEKYVEIPVENYTGILPSDFVYLNQIVINNVGVREATDTFHKFYKEMTTADNFEESVHIKRSADYTFKIQGDYIYTSLEKCIVKMSYRAIPIDEDGFPLIPDNPTMHRALQAFIELEYLRILWRNGKVTDKVYEDAKQLYAFAVGAYETDARKIDLSMAETLTNLNTLLPRRSEFIHRFRNTGTVENWKTR